MIHFFGDSFTYCQGCTLDHEYYQRTYNGTQKTWVELISEYIDDSYINNGISGVGNQKIFDNIVEQLHIIKENDIVIISRADDTRFMAPNSAEHHHQVIINLLLNLDYKYKDWNDEAHKAVREYFKKVIVPYLPAITNRFNDIFFCFKRYFESRGIKVIEWNVNEHLLDENDKPKYSIISDEHPDINDSHWSWKGHEEFFKFIKNKYDELT